MINNIRSLKDVLKKINFILNKEQKWKSIVVFILTLIGAIFETLGVSIVIPLIQAMLTPREIFQSKYLHGIFEIFRIHTDKGLIVFLCVVVVLVYLLKNAYLAYLSYVRVKFSSDIQRELSGRLMYAYMSRGYSFFLNVNTGELMRGITSDVAGVYSVLYQFFRILAEGLTALCICIFIFIADWVMALSIAGLGIVCIVIISGVFKGLMSNLGAKYRDYGAEANQHALQAFNGIKEILVMNRQQYFIDSYTEANRKYQSAQIGQNVGVESPTYIIEALCVSGLIITVATRIFGGVDAILYIPKLAAFAVAAFRILPSLGRISSSLNVFVFSCQSLNAAYNDLVEISSFLDKDKPRIERNYNNVSAQKFENELVVDNISWRYETSKNEVLSNVSLKIKKGKSIALIGPSGAGKTTLADIILGLLVPQSGEILVDGKNIRDLNSEWNKMIGYVPQAVYLTDDTIRNNVAFGIVREKIDDNMIWESLKRAQIDNFIRSLPDGLDTYVGERGIRFSGGQRQRIAIARALYSDPDIIILDEATASLDNDTELAVMQAIDSLHGKKTLIIIAHRLSTIKNCDEIYEVMNAKVVRKDNVYKGEKNECFI